MESNAWWKDNVQSKIKSYAGTNYLSPRCRPVSSLGYVEAKNRTAASLTGANKQTNVPFPSLGGVRVEASGKSRSSCRLVHAGVLSKATGKILRLASYPKRPARSLFRHISHLTALSLRRVHVWMQVQHLQ